jgi:hypothetical protein
MPVDHFLSTYSTPVGAFTALARMDRIRRPLAAPDHPLIVAGKRTAVTWIPLSGQVTGHSGTLSVTVLRDKSN